MRKISYFMLSLVLMTCTVFGVTACNRNPQVKGELTISVYKAEEWLVTAAKMFEERNPGVKISIHNFYDDSAEMDIYSDSGVASGAAVPVGQTREDYISRLNTQILSGEAEDLIITSIGIPVDRYISMGVFEDLSPYLEQSEEITEDNCYMNIFDAYRTKNGGLYQFPISAMAVPLMCFDNKLMENTGVHIDKSIVSLTWRESLDLAKEMYDKSTLDGTYMIDMRTTVGNIFTKAAIDSIDYETGTVQMDKNRMLEILKVFVEMADYKSMPSDFDMTREVHTPFSIRYQVDWQVAADMLLYDNVRAAQWEYDDGNVYLCPYYALDFGINSASEEKELAWEFLKFFVSEDIQTLPSLPWAGVNKKGLAARISGEMKSNFDYTEEEIAVVTTQVEKWILEINAYKQEDAEIINISEDELESFLNGKTSALETVDNLERKLEQYINE